MTVPRYLPPTRVSTIELPWLSMVTRADPYWSRDRHHEIEYVFTNKVVYCNPDTTGAYNDWSSAWQQGQPNIPNVRLFTLDESTLGGGDLLG